MRSIKSEKHTRIARGPDGEAIILETGQGGRYIYEDGTIDARSRVETRAAHVAVAGCVDINDVSVQPVVAPGECQSPDWARGDFYACFVDA